MGQIKSSKLSPSGETEGANITTMKRYIKPAIEVIELNVSGSILLVLSKTEEEMGGDSALSDEHRSDWDNIWGNM